MKRRIVSALLENEAGALSRVVGLFAQRNYNIESLTVAPTEDSSLSRLTLTTSASDAEIEQITKQLNKLVEVVKLADITESAHVERELMLVKVKAGGAGRAEVKRLADIFRAQIVDVTSHLFTIQVIGTTDKLDAFIEALSEGQVVEVVRTGVTGLSRGTRRCRCRRVIVLFPIRQAQTQSDGRRVPCYQLIENLGWLNHDLAPNDAFVVSVDPRDRDDKRVRRWQ